MQLKSAKNSLASILKENSLANKNEKKSLYGKLAFAFLFNERKNIHTTKLVFVTDELKVRLCVCVRVFYTPLKWQMKQY